MLKNELLEKCPGCEANLAKIEGPTHRYIGASAACWEIYSALNAGMPALAPDPITPLLVDAYAAQHPGTPSPQSIQSVAVHLLTLYGVLVKNVAYENTLWIRRRALRTTRNQKRSKHTRYQWLTPPSFARTTTVADIARAPTPAARTQQAKQYIHNVWQTWSQPHISTISEWYERFVLSDPASPPTKTPNTSANNSPYPLPRTTSHTNRSRTQTRTLPVKCKHERGSALEERAGKWESGRGGEGESGRGGV